MIKKIMKIQGAYIDPELVVRAIVEVEDQKLFTVKLDSVGAKFTLTYENMAELKKDMKSLRLKMADWKCRYFLQPDFVYDIIVHEYPKDFDNRYQLEVYSFGCKSPFLISYPSEAGMLQKKHMLSQKLESIYIASKPN